MVLGIDSSASKGDTEGKNLTDIQGDVSKNMGAVCGAAFQNTNIFFYSVVDMLKKKYTIN